MMDLDPSLTLQPSLVSPKGERKTLAGERRRPLRERQSRGGGVVVFGVTTLFAAACGETVTNAGAPLVDNSQAFCTINQNEIHNSTSKDGIPALTNPAFVEFGGRETDYLSGESRVIGFFDGDQPLAIPLNIMWYHEIVNLDLDGSQVSFTHCPLTGSTLAFDRGNADGVEFGVSGLLYRNNLVMYDRGNRESLWPQMLGGARCGDLTGTKLEMIPFVEMSWPGWQEFYPNTLVVSKGDGIPRPYEQYPYPFYDIPDNPVVLYPMEVDLRRPPKERVLGIPNDLGGIALPYGVMDREGPVSATHLTSNGEPLVVFWDRSVQGAGAFKVRHGDLVLSFEVSDGRVVDRETGSVWQVDGLAVEGALAGSRLEPLPEAIVAYWFAWPAFYPDIQLRGNSS